MTPWEFTYVGLWHDLRGGPDEPRVRDIDTLLRRTQARIAELGSAGWEPVGEVDFRFSFGGDPPTHIRQLLFKRPVADG